MSFTRAIQTRGKARLALVGPSGSGKTYTALSIAQHMGDRVALIDTERGSASKYAKKFTFDVLELDSFDPRRFVAAIEAAGEAGYDVLIVDSLSHEWSGKDGALQLVDKVASQRQGENKFVAWNTVTPLHDAVFEAILRSPCHVIGTMRAKMEFVLETNDRGKQVPRKVGMGAVQRDNVEYEFDVVADLDMDHNFIVTKTRCEELDGEVVSKAGGQVAAKLLAWLSEGVEAPPRPAPPEPAPAPAGRTQRPAGPADDTEGGGTTPEPQSIYADKATIERIQALVGAQATAKGVDGADVAADVYAELKLERGQKLTQMQADAVVAWLEARAPAEQPA